MREILISLLKESENYLDYYDNLSDQEILNIVEICMRKYKLSFVTFIKDTDE